MYILLVSYLDQLCHLGQLLLVLYGRHFLFILAHFLLLDPNPSLIVLKPNLNKNTLCPPLPPLACHQRLLYFPLLNVVPSHQRLLFFPLLNLVSSHQRHLGPPLPFLQFCHQRPLGPLPHYLLVCHQRLTHPHLPLLCHQRPLVHMPKIRHQRPLPLNPPCQFVHPLPTLQLFKILLHLVLMLWREGP